MGIWLKHYKKRGFQNIGRIGRKEYKYVIIYYGILNFGVLLAALVAFMVSHKALESEIIPKVLDLYAIYIMVRLQPALAGRWADIGAFDERVSYPLSCVVYVTSLFWVYVIALYFVKGKSGDNEYGKDPKSEEKYIEQGFI